MIVSSRLLIREPEESDWLAVHAFDSDPEVVRYMSRQAETERDAQEFIQRAISWRQQEPRWAYGFVVAQLSDRSVVGWCDVSVNHSVREALIGWRLGHRYWGQGFATEIAQTLLSFCFQELGLHRVSAECVVENVASARVMEKIGMRREGLLREKVYFKGRWWDNLIYGILDQEWNAARNRSPQSPGG